MKDCSCEINDGGGGEALASSEEGRVHRQREQLVIEKEQVPDINSIMCLGGIVTYLRLAPNLIKMLVSMGENFQILIPNS